jgi:serine/threonine protein kinase
LWQLWIYVSSTCVDLTAGAPTYLFYRYGKALLEVCDRFRKAKSEIAERVARIEALWLRTKLQLKLLRELAPLLDEEHRNIQDETLKVFASKLDLANTKLRSFLKKDGGNRALDNEGKVKSSRYALFGTSLDAAINELDTWQRMFDPSWYLIMKAASPRIDAELQALIPQPARLHVPITRAQSLRAALNDDTQVAVPIFLPPDGLDHIRVSAIPYCAASFGKRDNGSSNVILDHMTCPVQANTRIRKMNIRNLARKLSHTDPTTFGLLSCKGVIEQGRSQNQHNGFTMVFRVPQEYSEPQSLRSWLLSGESSHSLSDRFRIATQMAQSIGYVHTFGFVHKNVLPETILIFKSSESTIGSVSLVGFGNFRDAEGGTLRSGDTLWEKNIYRHPRRQGQIPQDDYIMQHDIYSLGVCLLEIGLWESFVVYEGNQTVPSPSTLLRVSENGLKSQQPSLIKDHLLSMTREFLPRRMGTIYSEVVETCLTCLDEDNTDFGNEQEFLDADGILIGVRYIEKVCFLLLFDEKALLSNPDHTSAQQHLHLNIYWSETNCTKSSSRWIRQERRSSG